MVYSVIQSGSSWRIYEGGSPVARIWSSSHADRIVRDGQLAIAVRDALGLGSSARRTAIRAAYDTWTANGGHSVDFSTLTLSLNNDAGQEDGNLHIYIAGNELGYLHGVDTTRDNRFARIVRLCEEIFSAEQLGTSGARNSALDSAVDRFVQAGALN